MNLLITLNLFSSIVTSIKRFSRQNTVNRKQDEGHPELGKKIIKCLIGLGFLISFPA